MRFDELRGVIEKSSADDWHRVSSTGPMYRDRFHSWTAGAGAEGEVHMGVDWHHSHAVLREDIDVSVTWGMDRSYDAASMRAERDDRFPFSENFPDSSVNVFIADIFYRGQLVDREHLVTVDGGRGSVPLGRTRRKDGANATSRERDDYFETCTQWEHDFARLIDELSGGSDFRRYFDGTEYVIEG